MAYRFYIDGQLTDAPVNEFELSTSIRRESETDGINVTQDVELVYNANNDLNVGEVSGYSLLYTAFESGTCNELILDIYDQVSNTLSYHVYQGVIKVPSMMVELQTFNIKTKVQDNSFYAYINNNKNIKYNLTSQITKNGQSITPAIQSQVQLFDTVTGNNVTGVFYGIKITDAFDYLVRALSDNKVGFFSNTLNDVNDTIIIFTGSALIITNAGIDSQIITSFEELYNELKKVRNIGYYIDRTNLNNPILVMEDLDLLYSGNNILDFNDIKEMDVKINTDNIYATINVGATKLIDGASTPLTFPEFISYLGFQEEDYVPLGQCNFDNELDLVNEFAITSNMISDQIFGAVTTNLDTIFMIECAEVPLSSPVFYRPIKYPNWVGAAATGLFFYNKGFTNAYKLTTQNSNYQASTVNTLSPGVIGFQASLGAEQTAASFDPASPFYVGSNLQGYLTSPIIFVDETSGSNYDGGFYDNTSGIYVAPLDGNYSFSTTADLRITDCNSLINCTQIFANGVPGLSSGIYDVGTMQQQFFGTILIRVYSDNTLSTLLYENSNTVTFASNGFYSFSTNWAGNLVTGNAVIALCNIDGGLFVYNIQIPSTNQPVAFPQPNLKILVSQGATITPLFGSGCSFPSVRPICYYRASSYFTCNGSPDGQLTFGASDPMLFKNKIYTFQYDINTTDFETIKANPTGLFKFEKDNIERYGWIKEMKRNDWTGMTTVSIITNNAATPQ